MNNNPLLPSKAKKNTAYMVFRTAGRRYAVDINLVIEVINIPELEIPSVMPEGIIGVFNYKGMIIKAVDLCPLLGFQPEPFSINNRMIILMKEDNCFALHAEIIDGIVSPSAEEIQPVPYEKENSVIKKVFPSEDGGSNVNITDIDLLDEVLRKNKDKPGKVDYLTLIPKDEKSNEIFKLRSIQNKENNVFTFAFNLNVINQYVLFTLGNQGYYLDLKYVKEFISYNNPQYAKLPYTRDFIRGLINIKGSFLVVFDLKCFLSNELTELNKNVKIIVAKGKNFNIAVLVDDIKYIKTLSDLQIKNANSTLSKYIFSEFEEEGELYGILNFEKIINDEQLYINTDI